MKKAWKIAAPFLVIAAAFIVYYAGIGTQYMYSDIRDHEDRVLIEKWSGYRVISGSGGAFRPDDSITRAELCTVISRVVELGDEAENRFTDVDGDAWYASALLRCVAAGILVPEGTEAGPGEAVTRQDAFAMFARAFGLSAGGSTEMLSAYREADKVTAANAPYVEALLEAGMVQERTPGCLNPTWEITRAEVVQVLDKAQAAGYIVME